MRSNFSFDATFYAIHMPNMKKRGKLRAKIVLSVFPLVACACVAKN
jgi:hypothetical protein